MGKQPLNLFNEKHLELMAKLLIKRGLTVSVAESVTSGFIQASLSSATNARKFFQGGITAYNLGQKTKHLNVDPVHCEATNCVSAKVALEMAINVSKIFLSDIGISITGYAAPAPEIDIEKVFAFYSIVLEGTEMKAGKLHSSFDSPVEVQLDYTNQLIRILSEVIRK